MKTNTQPKHANRTRPLRQFRRFVPILHWRVFPYGRHWVAESLTGQQIWARSRWQLENTLDTFNQIY